MILVECEQGSPEWLQARAGACTASKFCTARERMKANRGTRKVGDPTGACESYAWLLAFERIAQAPLDDTFTTYAMRRGRELEPIARQAYEARFGAVVEESGVMLTDDRQFGYSTDGQVLGERGGIEVKCPVASDKLGAVWQHPEEAEDEYIDQIDGGMWVAHWEWVDLVVYCPWLESVGKELFVKRIWRDDNRIAALETDLVAFLRMSQRYEALLRNPEIPTRYERMSQSRTPVRQALPASIFA